VKQPLNLGHIITVPVASFMAFLTIVGTQGSSGDKSIAILALDYAGLWFILFGLAALIPKLFTSFQRKSAVATLVSFGEGGGISGGLFLFYY
jgi:hypothetical protein